MEPEYKKIVAVGKFSYGDNVTGRVSIVTEYKHLRKLREGDIVVAPYIHESWGCGLHLSAGIITEKGINDNYALSLGQKFRIPVIVGVREATKKITDGSFITLDCERRVVCQAINNDYVITTTSQNNHNVVSPTKSEHAHKHLYYYLAKYFDHDNDASIEKEELKLTKSTDDHHKHHAYLLDITAEKLRRDAPVIKKYVTETVAYDIGLAKTVGKWAATFRVSGYAYDSIPFEFFTDHNAIEEVFARLEDGVDYMQELEKAFKSSILANAKTINQSELAEFLYGHAVDKINVTDEDRDLLKKEPIKMDEFVKKGKIKREEYMFVTLCNFTFRHYLEEDFRVK